MFQQENLLSTIEKDRNILDLNFTPEHMKIVDTKKTPSINPNNELNNRINNINTNENN